VAPTTTTTRPNQLDRGSMHGRGQGQDLGVDFIDNDSGVKVGDVVLTSGVRSSLFPPDILCGVVSVATRNAGSLQLDVRVTPAADLEHLNFVKVLLWAPPQ
jgi:cell shape-determining protein MreC